MEVAQRQEWVKYLLLDCCGKWVQRRMTWIEEQESAPLHASVVDDANELDERVKIFALTNLASAVDLEWPSRLKLFFLQLHDERAI